MSATTETRDEPRPGTARRAAEALAAIDAAREQLLALSRDIHAHPELNYEEHHAAAALADALEGWGFAVERGVGGVETAFRASARGAGDGPTVAFLAEYDALPEIGHGCGHNLIALSAAGGGLGARAALAGLGGTIQVIGTPAEEGGGGKIRLLEAGVFYGVDVALSSHPASHRTVIPTEFEGPGWGLAMIGFRYAFHGKASHAAVAPHDGVNALNAVLRLFSGIDTLRQHLRDDVRIHGIITDGGKAPNVVPDFAAANFMLRSRDRDHLREVVEKVRRVAEGAAIETGARLEIVPYYPFVTPEGTHAMYENGRPNSVLARLARRHAVAAGLRLDEPPKGSRSSGGASSDFGNVSQAIPAFALGFAVSDRPVPGHTAAMRDAAATDLAHANAIAVAKTLALVAVDLLAEPGLLAEARADFAAREQTEVTR
ncbi:MAG: M20 family metallopeptidase [Candidatus Limnocylindria bacterium]